MEHLGYNRYLTMFKPSSGPLVRDDVLESDGDWSFSTPSAQGMIDSAIRLLPQDGILRTNERGWPNVPWDERDELEEFPGAIDSGWTGDFDNLTVSNPQIYETELGFLKIATAAGERQALSSREWAGDNAEGWTVQVRLTVAEAPTTDFGELAGHSIVVDDGVHREEIFLHQDHIYLENADRSYDIDLSSMRQIRIAGRGEDITVLFDDGRVAEMTGEFTGASVQPELTIGSSEAATGDYETHWDYVFQHWLGDWADTRPLVTQRFVTTPAVATSSVLEPAGLVSSWTRLTVEATGSSGGTTTVGVQWRDGNGDWTTLSTTEIAVGINHISLGSIPVRGDGTDALRFVVTQVSDTGSEEPPAVDALTVEMVLATGALLVKPNWGPASGGQTVMVEIGQDALLVGRQPLSTNTADAEPGETFEDRIALIPADGSLDETVGPATAVESGAVSYRAGLYGQAAVLGELAALSGDFSSALNTFGDSAYGRVGVGVTPIIASGLELTEDQISLKGLLSDPFQSSEPAQGATAPVGGGFSVTGVGSVAVDGNCFGFALQILYGSVSVEHGSYVHHFYAHDYKSPRWVTLKADTVDEDLVFTALEDSQWRIGRPRLYDIVPGSATVAVDHQVGSTGFGVEARVTPYVFSDEDLVILSTLTGNNGWEIGIRDGGLLYVVIGDGSSQDQLEAKWPIVAGERKHVALNFRIFSDHQRLQLLVNGEICAEKVTTLTTVSAGTDLTIGTEALLQVEEIAIQSEAFDARALSVRRGIASPLFEVDTDVPVEDENVLILNFDEETGPIRDSSTYKNHCYLPVTGRPGFYRSVAIESRSKASLWNTGLIKCLHNPSLSLTLPLTIYAKGRFWAWSGITQTLFKKANAGGTQYVVVEILENGLVRVRANSGGSEQSLTSDVSIADQKVRALAAVVDSASITIMIDSVVKTGAITLGALSALDQDIEIGSLCTCHISALVLRLGTLDQDTFDSWRDRNDIKRTITSDKIYLGGVQVDPTAIRHTHPRRKYFVAPARDAGEASVYAIAEAASPGVALASELPYTYLLSYLREIGPLTFGQAEIEDSDGHTVPVDTEESAATATKSPFRILHRVPGDAVGLAYVQAPQISTERLVGVVPLEHETAENLSTYFGGEFALTGPAAVQGGLLYSSQLDTRDVQISNRAVVDRGVATPTPLYYKYLVGRGRFYTYNPNATTALDAQVVKESISIIGPDGQSVDPADFPWDIEISTVDKHGVALPSNIFSVVLFTRRLYIPGKTLWVRYPARDSANAWAFALNKTEVLNPVPIFERTSETIPGRDAFRTILETNGSYSLRIGT